MKKILIGILLLGSNTAFSQGTVLLKDNVKANTSFQLGTVKVTAIQKSGTLSDSTKIPTSLAVKNYVATSTATFVSVQQSRTTAGFDKTSNTTLSNIPGLTATLDSGKTYYFEARIYTTAADAGGGVKFAIYSTVSKGGLIYDGITTQGSASRQSRGTSWGNVVGEYTSATDAFTLISGTITGVTSNGTLTVQFAQNVSDGNTCTVMIGSVFIVSEIL